MAKKDSSGSTGHSWLASDAASSSDSGSIDSEHSYFENIEEANKIRGGLKGFPLIGKLKKKYQYTITIILAIISLAITLYTGFSSYTEGQKIKEVSIAANNIDSSLSLLNYQYGNYITLNDFELNKVNENKNKVDKYISILRANEDVNETAIKKLDDYWKLQSSKFNIIGSSKDQLSKNNALLKTSITNLKTNIDIISSLIKNISNRNDIHAYKSIYLTQILDDMQTLRSSLNSLSMIGVNYNLIMNDINALNNTVDKKIEMLLKAGVPEDISKALSNVQSNITASTNSISSIIRTISPIENALSKIKTSEDNFSGSISQIINSISEIENKEMINNYIFCIISFVLFIIFLISIFMVNSEELNKDIIVAEEQKRSVENAVVRIVNDINSIASGDYERKVRNTTDGLIGLKDAINKLVESFVDKFLYIHKVSTELKNDNSNYEKYHVILSEKSQNLVLNKSELIDNEKVSNNINLEIKANNAEINNILLTLLPEFIESQNNLNLFIVTTKEMDVNKSNMQSKYFRLSENFNKIKESIENLTKICEFVEALSLNSEILHKKNLSGSTHSFNRIAEDFNNKVQEIQTQCLSMSVCIEDSKNDLLGIFKNSDDLEKHSIKAKDYLNSIRKVFNPISNLLNTLKSNNNSFNQKNKTLNSLSEKNNNIINSIEETLRKTEANLNEFKELNKLNKLRVTDNYQNVRFIEKLNKD